MQTLEAVIYIALSVVIGGLLLGFLFRGYVEDFYQATVHQLTVDEQEFQIESEDFALELSKRWVDCSYGVINQTYAVHVTDTATIMLGDVIKELRRLDQCEEIDCLNESNRFRMPLTVNTPKLFNIECFNRTLIVS